MLAPGPSFTSKSTRAAGGAALHEAGPICAARRWPFDPSSLRRRRVALTLRRGEVLFAGHQRVAARRLTARVMSPLHVPRCGLSGPACAHVVWPGAFAASTMNSESENRGSDPREACRASHSGISRSLSCTAPPCVDASLDTSDRDQSPREAYRAPHCVSRLNGLGMRLDDGCWRLATHPPWRAHARRMRPRAA